MCLESGKVQGAHECNFCPVAAPDLISSPLFIISQKSVAEPGGRASQTGRTDHTGHRPTGHLGHGPTRRTRHRPYKLHRPHRHHRPHGPHGPQRPRVARVSHGPAGRAGRAGHTGHTALAATRAMPPTALPSDGDVPPCSAAWGRSTGVVQGASAGAPAPRSGHGRPPSLLLTDPRGVRLVGGAECGAAAFRAGHRRAGQHLPGAHRHGRREGPPGQPGAGRHGARLLSPRARASHGLVLAPAQLRCPSAPWQDACVCEEEGPNPIRSICRISPRSPRGPRSALGTSAGRCAATSR